jgi:hypothetical protein
MKVAHKNKNLFANIINDQTNGVRVKLFRDNKDKNYLLTKQNILYRINPIVVNELRKIRNKYNVGFKRKILASEFIKQKTITAEKFRKELAEFFDDYKFYANWLGVICEFIDTDKVSLKHNPFAPTLFLYDTQGEPLLKGAKNGHAVTLEIYDTLSEQDFVNYIIPEIKRYIGAKNERKREVKNLDRDTFILNAYVNGHKAVAIRNLIKEENQQRTEQGKELFTSLQPWDINKIISKAKHPK